MKKNRLPKISGVAIAIAAASAVSGCVTNKSHLNSATTDLIHCYGVNKCGGHNDCKTPDNQCAGHASCNGSGFVLMPSKACVDIGGEQRDDWRGEVAKADLIHCHGVNKCGGHNDCKTPDNQCAGHASCNGSGFVLMPDKACKDVGGKTG